MSVLQVVIKISLFRKQVLFCLHILLIWYYIFTKIQYVKLHTYTHIYKLKVFYKGETADHRYFSDEFADQLIRSLPYTPVVSRYDDESEDSE